MPFPILNLPLFSTLSSALSITLISSPFLCFIAHRSLLPMVETSNPPFLRDYGNLLLKKPDQSAAHRRPELSGQHECQLPLIDLSCFTANGGAGAEERRARASAAICRASSEWGFFQVVNHGIRSEVLRRMRREQTALFETPFERKASCGLLNNSYRWGNPAATTSTQFSWSEAFHVPLTKISEPACFGDFTSLREVMTELAAAMSKLAKLLTGILAVNLGHEPTALDDICQEKSCFLRLNRYPVCPVSPDVVSGLVPHTDSDFLTVLYQDQVGGLQLLKDSKWVSVKPNQDALIVNIGDLLQAWSNDVYKSVEHRVVANAEKERYSIAYFLCPSYDSFIGSCEEPSIYRKFTFRDYRNQVQEDVKKIGHKVGLPRFRLSPQLTH